MKQSGYIQLMRGIAVLLVLIGHAITDDMGGFLVNFSVIINCIHMPVFFVISGYLFQKNFIHYKERGAAKFFRSKALRLLLPYLIWTVLLWIIINAAFSFEGLTSFLRWSGFAPMSVGQMVTGLFTYEYYYTQHLWFLYVLFVFFAVNYFSNRLFSSWTGVSLLILVNVIYNLLPIESYILTKIFLWDVFFVLGRIAARTDWSFIRKRKGCWFAASLSVLFLTTVIWLSNVLVYTGDNLTIRVLMTTLFAIEKYLLGISGVVVIFYLSSFILSFGLGVGLSKIGDYSYYIYLMHNPYIVAFISIGLTTLTSLSPYLIVLAAVVAGIVLPMLISKFILLKTNILSIPFLGNKIKRKEA